jgi:hypothetical protein
VRLEEPTPDKLQVLFAQRRERIRHCGIMGLESAA